MSRQNISHRATAISSIASLALSVQFFGQSDQKTFSVVLDMEEGTLSFCVEGQFLGVAHRGLRGKKVIHEKYGNDDNDNDDNYNDDDDNDD